MEEFQMLATFGGKIYAAQRTLVSTLAGLREVDVSGNLTIHSTAAHFNTIP